MHTLTPLVQEVLSRGVAMPPLLPRGLATPPLSNATINLDLFGVAGFFGGDIAISAMATVYLHRGRRYLG